MIRAQLKKIFTEQPKWLLFAAIACLLLVVVDFNQRIKVGVNTALTNAQSDTQDLQLEPPREISWSEPMLQWQASLQHVTEQASEVSASTEAPVLPSMHGAIELGNLQVRVRGIFRFSSKTKADFALIESYNPQQQQHQISRYEAGADIGNYIVLSLQQNAVTFEPVQQNADNNLPTITIKVFDKTTTE